MTMHNTAESMTQTTSESILLVDNCHGRYMPAMFCESFSSALQEQGFSHDAQDIQSESEYADDAWLDILDNFEPFPGYHLEYGPCGDLFAVRNDSTLSDD